GSVPLEMAAQVLVPGQAQLLGAPINPSDCLVAESTNQHVRHGDHLPQTDDIVISFHSYRGNVHTLKRNSTEFRHGATTERDDASARRCDHAQRSHLSICLANSSGC